MRSREERWAGDRAGPAPPPGARPAPLQKRRREPREPQDYGAGSAGKDSAAAAGTAQLQVGNFGEQSWAAVRGAQSPPHPSGVMERGSGAGDTDTAPGASLPGSGDAAPGTGARYVLLPAWGILAGGVCEVPRPPAGSCCPPQSVCPGAKAPPGARGSPGAGDALRVRRRRSVRLPAVRAFARGLGFSPVKLF